MAPPSEVQVLCIPADKSIISLETLNTTTHHYRSEHTLDVNTVSLEKTLGHVPNLKHFGLYIDLSRRCLSNRDISVAAAPRKMSWREEYYIYKCIEETTARLPENEYFKKYCNARVYGDAFVFRVLQVKGLDGQEKAVFGDMKEVAKSVSNGGWASDYMHWMATF